MSGRDYKGWVGAGAKGILPPSSYSPSALRPFGGSTGSPTFRDLTQRPSGTLDLFNRSVIFLKALHGAVAVAGSGDALHGVVGTGEGRDVRDLVLDGGLADGALEPSAILFTTSHLTPAFS